MHSQGVRIIRLVVPFHYNSECFVACDSIIATKRRKSYITLVIYIVNLLKIMISLFSDFFFFLYVLSFLLKVNCLYHIYICKDWKTDLTEIALSLWIFWKKKRCWFMWNRFKRPSYKLRIRMLPRYSGLNFSLDRGLGAARENLLRIGIRFINRFLCTLRKKSSWQGRFATKTNEFRPTEKLDFRWMDNILVGEYSQKFT